MRDGSWSGIGNGADAEGIGGTLRAGMFGVDKRVEGYEFLSAPDHRCGLLLLPSPLGVAIVPVSDGVIDELQEFCLGSRGAEVAGSVGVFLVGDTSQGRVEPIFHLIFGPTDEQLGDLRPLRALHFKNVEQPLVLLLCPIHFRRHVYPVKTPRYESWLSEGSEAQFLPLPKLLVFLVRILAHPRPELGSKDKAPSDFLALERRRAFAGYALPLVFL